MVRDLFLREVTVADLPQFFAHQSEPIANHMAAFTPRDPSDQPAFMARWHRILGDPASSVQTIQSEEDVVGHVLSYEEAGRREVSYWIGQEYWGQGIATQALTQFLDAVVTERPLYARAAKDNRASLRVLEKCGFTVTGEGAEFSLARGEEVEEFVLELAL